VNGWLLRKLKDALVNGDNVTFMEHENGKILVHFDEIVIRAKETPERGLLGGKKYASNQYLLDFCLNGETLKTIEVENTILFSCGDTLSITKIEGVYEMKFDIN
jgi:hypothetical protein